jgi:hypothetical protein
MKQYIYEKWQDILKVKSVFRKQTVTTRISEIFIKA